MRYDREWSCCSVLRAEENDWSLGVVTCTLVSPLCVYIVSQIFLISRWKTIQSKQKQLVRNTDFLFLRLKTVDNSTLRLI